MFGMGFTEILLIIVIAIIFLGPEKLPQAMVDIAKFFRAFKKTLSDAKDSLDREINISEIKQEALTYQKSLQENTDAISKELKFENINTLLDPSTKEKLDSHEKMSAEDRAHTQENIKAQTKPDTPLSHNAKKELL